MSGFIKYFFLIIVSVLLLSIAARDFGWNATENKIDLVIWNNVLLVDGSHNSLEDFNDSQLEHIALVSLLIKQNTYFSFSVDIVFRCKVWY